MSDLKTLFGNQSEASLYKKLTQLVDEGVLIKVKRGMYATPSAKLTVVSSRISPDSYISLGTVLAEALVIGSIPARRVMAVKVGSPSSYTSELGTIEHLSIKPSLYLGFERRGECNLALPEKAFLDACYFMMKGRKLSFDPLEDVNMDLLDAALLRDFLEIYDGRFKTFIKKNWGL